MGSTQCRLRGGPLSGRRSASSPQPGVRVPHPGQGAGVAAGGGAADAVLPGPGPARLCAVEPADTGSLEPLARLASSSFFALMDFGLRGRFQIGCQADGGAYASARFWAASFSRAATASIPRVGGRRGGHATPPVGVVRPGAGWTGCWALGGGSAADLRGGGSFLNPGLEQGGHLGRGGLQRQAGLLHRGEVRRRLQVPVVPPPGARVQDGRHVDGVQPGPGVQAVRAAQGVDAGGQRSGGESGRTFSEAALANAADVQQTDHSQNFPSHASFSARDQQDQDPDQFRTSPCRGAALSSFSPGQRGCSCCTTRRRRITSSRTRRRSSASSRSPKNGA